MPEFSPPFRVRNGGNSLSRVSTSRAILRSEKPARTDMARATWSRAIASASAWKFPPLTLVPSGKMSGLSVAAFISIRRDAAAWSRAARTAARPWGMHRTVQGSRTARGEHGRAVDDRQSFFRRQDERGQVRLGERLHRGQDLSVDLRVAFANQYEAHVGQGSQVAARTERAAGRDHRMDAAVQELQEAGHEDPTDAGVAHRERVRPEQECGP